MIMLHSGRNGETSSDQIGNCNSYITSDGWDFLLVHHAVLDLRKGILTMRNGTTVPLLYATETAPLSCNTGVLSPVAVLAMSQMTLLAKVQPTIGVPDL